MKLKLLQNKLLKNGYLPEEQCASYEQWIDVRENGTTISFSIKDDEVTSALKVHGRRPDRPECDEFNSDFTRNISEAIRMSRL
ncbi:MAG: hypothetical protein CME70_19115 [Halobacteriovorax sp.]|nr:hypothetical protein [Halobacteriovorax sp.]|tara:strand:- start:178 stop:426 length:249 start_codon:yes stop_codon:yes gene_type:complete